MPQKNVHLYYSLPVAMEPGLPYIAKTDTDLPNGAIFNNAEIGVVQGMWSEQVRAQISAADAHTITVAINNINGGNIGPDPNVDLTINVVVNYL
jgi:hypothetical protein